MTQAPDLQQAFLQAVSQCISDSQTSLAWWREIELAYSGQERYYHNLQHLRSLLAQLAPLRADILDWHAVVLAIAYHDMVYLPTAKDNEERSAELAVQRLSGVVDNAILRRCEALILATKSHEGGQHKDMDFFTDADLSILGAPAEEYRQYALNIRKEYAVYPDEIYAPGREKVLRHFLSMPRIFKTDWFYNRYEQTARKNLVCELSNFNNQSDEAKQHVP